MTHTNEIHALFTLIDDPDEEVFGAVSDRIVGLGSPIIPDLENLWENTPSESVQNRIELLIHRLHFTDLSEDIRQWSLSGHHDLLVGALLAARFQYPDLSAAPVMQEIEKVRRNIWLELNQYLTPLEQATIMTSILYSYYGLKGTETNYKEPQEFLLQKTLEARRGNQVSNGILYLILCERLDLPVRAVRIPKQFILGYLKPGYSDPRHPDPKQNIEFFIDPTSGLVFTHQDVSNYLERIAEPPSADIFRPQSNKQVVQQLLSQLGRCFDTEAQRYKQEELQQLVQLLDDN
jgi:regulator of sirC expression with transglutaminase-like and TPR domain